MLAAKGRFESSPVTLRIESLTAGLNSLTLASANELEVLGYHRGSACVDAICNSLSQLHRPPMSTRPVGKLLQEADYFANFQETKALQSLFVRL